MSVAVEPITSRRSLIGLAVALVVCFAASSLGNLFTQPNLDWYATLVKPSFTPPNSIFPIVWTILFVMMAVSAWLVWRAPADEGEKRTALIWFGIQLAINVLWSFAFFCGLCRRAQFCHLGAEQRRRFLPNAFIAAERA